MVPLKEKVNIILGNGQVGNVIKNNIKQEYTKYYFGEFRDLKSVDNGTVKNKIFVYDVGEWEKEENIKCDYLHICIPYSDKFVDIVNLAKKVFTPEIVVVHSTVEVGTCEKIGDVLYSPVTGRHEDDFENNVKQYKKYISGKKEQYDEVRSMFKLMTRYWGENTSELEYSKVMSTTRMYWDLLLMKVMEKDCKDKGFDFENVYTKWTRNYNEGIVEKRPDWVRTIYDKMETELPGGHCLRPNIHLINNKVTQFIIDYEKEIEG